MGFSSNPKLTEFDRQTQAGLKVVLGGEQALAATPDAMQARHLLFRLRCACGHRGFVSNYRLAERGLGSTPIGAFAARLRCENRCRAPPTIEVVDPDRSALDPD
jgi:hypothetical protein